MKALFFRQHGDASVLQYGDLPIPVTAEGHALIKVSATTLNHLDIWVRRGWPGLNLALPHIGGSDIVGGIVEINGDSTFSTGDRVYVYSGINSQVDEWTERGEESVSPGYKIIGEHSPGGFAEYVSIPLANLFLAPPKMSDDILVAPLLTGLTAWRMLKKQAALQSGESVLVVGTGGGVNSISIQIAKALGASVIALAGSNEKCMRARALGASEVINYRDKEDWAKEVLKVTNKRGVDLVVDNVGEVTFTQSLKALRRGGRLVTVGNTTGFNLQIDNRLIFGKQLSIIGSTMGSRNDFIESQQFIHEHAIIPEIDCIAPLSDGIAQLARLERGEQCGKIILRIDEESLR
jgi:NADPH:quinone reductase-like Zn-dependent oxidoreductase